MNVAVEFEKYCIEKGIKFQMDSSVSSYDGTTLFCPAGMQQFKSRFTDPNYKGTVANIQSCIRMNDFEEIGDATHLLYFNMMGLFSFRQMTVSQAIDFWVEFIDRIGLRVHFVTIHPDKPEWRQYYGKHDISVNQDRDCKWSDGEIGGYCTEFFIDNIEIGNIVNPLGDCIDVGFGLERLQSLVTPSTPRTAEDTLKETANKIIELGIQPSNVKQGYVLRKILRELSKMGSDYDHPFFLKEVERQTSLREKYLRLLPKHQDKSKDWWFETHGINIDEFNG